MPQTLPVSRFVKVGVALTPVAAPAPTLNTGLVLGTSNVIDTVTRIMEFASLDEVALYFGSTTEEYLAATSWFGQDPKPDTLNIGRWANVPTSGELVCGRLSAANQLVSAWTGITTGGFSVSFDGAAVTHYTGMNFSACANLNAVAAVINTALGVSGGCFYDANNLRFVITSDTTGANSSVSFLTAATAGVDISAMLAGLAANAPAAYLVPGLGAQSAIATVQIFDNQYPGQWYALFMPSSTPADFAAIAAYFDGGTNSPHFQGFNSQDAGCINPASTTDVMYTAKQAAYKRSAIQYSSQSGYAVESMMARILTTNWSGSNTTITLMFKQEPGITPEYLSTTQANAIVGKNGNVYAASNDGTANIQPGITPSGQYIDTVVGCDWLQTAIQNACYNLLRSTPKIPQTDAGMHQLGTAIEGVCAQAVVNGLAAAGVWTGPSFGQLQTGQTLAKGYYVYVPPISSQSQADRQTRKSVPIQVAIKLAGAVQEVDVLVDVNP